MSDPFASSKSNLAWAKETLWPDLDRRLREFHTLDPYAKVIEPDPHNPGWEIHKIKLIQPFPESFGNLTSDIVVNLRSALDNAGHAIAIATGKPDARNTAFPFAKDIGHMASSIGQSADLPKEIQSLFCGFQPYRGGNDFLWALNELCNGNKHKFLTPMQTVMWRGKVAVRGFGRPFSMPDPHKWDSANNEMVVVRLGPIQVPDATWDYDFDFFPFVAINEISIVESKPILAILSGLCQIVEGILMAIEAESKRLGITKQSLPCHGSPHTSTWVSLVNYANASC